MGLNRRIVVALLLLSPVFVALQGQTAVMAFLVTSTSTVTWTGYTTGSYRNLTIQYETSTQVTDIANVTFTTYTTTRVTMVPVPVLVTEVYPVVMTTNKVPVTYYVTKTGYAMAYSPAKVTGTVTSHYLTTETLTWFTTSASTSTYTTSTTIAQQAHMLLHPPSTTVSRPSLTLSQITCGSCSVRFQA